MSSAAVSPNPAGERVVRNTEYYLLGGDVVFRVENHLFRVHRYFFTRDSSFFRDKLPHPPPPGEFTKGSSDNNPFVLEETLIVDFERLLWVFYNPQYSIYNGTVEEWSSILHLAHQWDFLEVKAFALRELEQHEIDPLQKVILYHTHEIDRDLLRASYIALTERNEPITIEEGRVLGLETALTLARAREMARVPVFAGKKPGTPRSNITLGSAEMDTLIKDLFNLSLPDVPAERPRPPTPQTPTGRGTPTGGRNTPRLDIQTNGSGTPGHNAHRGANGVNGHTNGTHSARGGRK